MRTTQRALHFLLPTSLGIVAGVVGGIAGGVGAIAGAVVGGVNAKKQRELQKEASEAQRAALDEEMDFQEKQYADWEAVYGSVRENLSQMYQDLTPEVFAASGLARLNEEYQQQYNDFERQFAQRGIDSPTQDMMQGMAGLEHAEASAKIRNDAELQTLNAQQSFLNSNTVNPVGAGISNSYNRQAGYEGQQAQIAANQAAQYDASTQSSIAGIGSSIGGIATTVGAGTYTGVPPTTGNVTSLGLGTSGYAAGSAAITPSFQSGVY